MRDSTTVRYSYEMAVRVAEAIAIGETPDPAEHAACIEHWRDEPSVGTGDLGERPDAGEILGDADPIDQWEDDDDFGFLDDDADDWDTFDDDQDGTIALAPADAARLTLADVIALKVDELRAVESDAASLMAEALTELLDECSILGHPADASTFLDRRDALLDARAAFASGC